MTSRACARLGLADPILPDVTSQKLKPGLIAFSGMTNATFGFMQAQAHLGEPRLEQLLTVLKPLALLVAHHTILGIGDAPGVWGGARAGLGHPMQRDQRQERGTATARGRPGGGGRQVAIVGTT